MNKMITQLFSAKIKAMFYFVCMIMCIGISTSNAQTNVALSATAFHSGGGAGVFLYTNYNDNSIVTSTGCSDATGNVGWGWVTNGGSISYTWGAPVTFDKIVLYKCSRPMSGCTMEYWDGSAFVPFLTYSSANCPADSVTFPPVTTTILRFSNCVSTPTNPNHREIQVWSTPTVVCTTPTAHPTALSLTPGIFDLTGSFTAAAGSPERYLTIMTTTSTPPSAPVDGVNYFLGSSALGGIVVGNGPGTTFSASGLTAATQYWFWVYSCNAFCIGGPAYLATAPLSGTATTNTCSLSGIKTVGPTGDYPTMAAALTALHNFGMVGPVTLEIQTTYAGEPLPITIDGAIPCISAVNTLTIRPQGVLNLAAPAGTDMIILDGAKYVTIDGRIGSTGTTKSLTLANQSATGTVIRFINGASNNTIKYCRVLGENTNIDNANIMFSTSTGLSGNSDNTIDRCDIMDDGIGTPLYCVFSEGTAGKENTNNTISNCNIANFFNAATASRGVFFSTATTNCTITGNRFYQTVPRTYTGAVTHCPIAVVNTTTGNAFSITNNIIGYSSSAGTGTYTMNSAAATGFQGIMMNVAEVTPSTVQGNTITNLNISSTTATASGIALVTGGLVNVIGNTIGATTGTDAIVKTNSTNTTTPAFIGITSTIATPGVVNIENNNIGSITVNGTATTVGATVQGISVTSTAAATITGNTIGSTTTANSISSATVATGTQLVYGIIATISSTTPVPPVISNNTIANLNASGTSTATLLAGILFNSTSSGIITNNRIRNLSCSSGHTTLTVGQMSLSGIAYTGGTGTATISQNTINTLTLTNTGTTSTNVAGIGYTSSVNGTISRNRIYDLRHMGTGTTATAPPRAVGINCYNPSGSVTILNNMISLGDAQTSNTAFTGIMQGGISSTATIRIYNNSVNIQGTAASGALATTALLRGNYSATVYNTPFDVQNNILSNTRTGGTGKHYAIANSINGTASSVGWDINASNNNILNGNAATIGYWSADRTFATWKSTSGSDLSSYSGTPVTFTSPATGDLHINMGLVANNIESHGVTISGVNDDYDGDARPGPAGSVNGGGFSYDIGADEFDGVAIENLPPVISHTALLNACGGGNRTFTANILDPSGVPTGVTRPRVYYKKGAGGTWFSNAGTLSSGTALNGTWSFTILAADMGGLAIADQVYYYIIAQDVPGNVGSIPAGVTATNVNTVITPPPAPNVYAVQQAIGGPYNVGISGDFTTITSAVAAYNNFCLSGPVTFNLTDATYPTETFPITINSSVFSSSINTLTIKPAPGATPVISGSAIPALFVLNGGDYVTIDGSNNPVPNTICPFVSSTRDLTITNTNTSTASAVIWLQSAAGPNGATNNIIRNCNIFGANNTQTLFGIGMGSTTVSTTSVGTDNDNNRIENNSIKACQNGIYTRGASAANKNQGNVINQNVMTGAAPTDNLTDNGILTGFEDNITISGNRISNISNTAAQDLVGISLGINSNTILATSVTGAEVTNATVTYNVVDNITTPTLTTSAIGIAAFGPASGTTTIANNMLGNIGGKQTGSDLAAGIFVYGSLPGGSIDLLYNTIKISGLFAGGTVGSFGIAINGTSNPVVNMKNNLVLNDMLNGSAFRYAVGIGYTGATNITSDYNNFFITGGNFGVVGSLTTAGTVAPTLAAWQTNTGYDLNSKNVQPTFVSSTDLHVAPVFTNAGFMNAGTPVSVTTDMDCAVRSGTPDMGADEFNIPNCTGAVAGVATAGTATFCNAGVTSITTVGPSTGLGTSYQWQISTDSVSWSPIADANSATYTLPSPIATTTYYRMKVGCSFTSTFDSTTAKITVIPNPANISGPSTMCVSSAYTLVAPTGGGTWSSSDMGVATVGTAGDVMTTATGGTANISYTLGNGCSAVKTVIVSSALPVVTAPATPATICAGESSTLNGAFTNPGASSYAISRISYAPETFTPIGTLTSVSVVNGGNLDDGYFTVTLPFDFTYYGTTYTAGSDAFIAVNGYLTFGSGHAAASFIGNMPVATYPATISLFGMDLELTFSGSITYGVTGTAPNRKFIVSYNGVPDWRNDVPDSLFEYGQIILYETSNNVELHVGTMLGVGTHSIGIQSNLGAQASVIPGQNNVIGAVYASAWQFSSVSPTFSWASDPTLSATDVLAPVAGPLNTTTTYTLNVTASNGCSSSVTPMVSVNPLPAVIGGANNVCEGFSTTLTNADAGGTWSSSNPTVGSIDMNTGVVAGLTPGTTIMSYTFTGSGCSRTMPFTVNQTPGAIGGTAQVCVGAATTLTDADAGGTWISTNVSTATIGLSSGVVTGLVAGTSLITYELPTGCRTTAIVSVNPLPALSVTPSTITTLCIGESTSAYTASATMPGFLLLNQNFNSSLAGWTIDALVGSPAGQWQIVPAGFDGSTGDGTPMLQASPFVEGGALHTRVVSPSFSTVGYGTATLTFNQYFLSDVDPLLAVEYSVNGGPWQTLINYTGTPFIGSNTWSAASPEATLAIPAGAINQPDVRLRWNYDGSFYGWFLDNIKVSATLPPATYAWTGGSDLSCATCTNPTITPSVTGSNVYTVTATSSAGCSSDASVTINVNPLPALIAGTQTVCEGLTTTLTNADAGGTWTSSTTSVATVVGSTGVVTGELAGTSTITYALPTGCARTAVVTVNELPAVIGGTLAVCEGLTTTLTETTPAGTWISSNTTVATIDGAGLVMANVSGNTTITYTITATGCIRTAEVTVNALPAMIGGMQAVCEGLTTTLTNTDAGGTWTSGTTSVATVVPATGVVTGVLAGNSMITYILPTGCIRSTEVTVNELPAAIGGTLAVCEGLTTTLTNATPSGSWSSSAPTIATIDGSGMVTGHLAGNSTITYMLIATGCISTEQVTVNALPAMIGGTQDVCVGSATTLSNVTPGGTWTSDNTAIATIGLNTGVAVGVMQGNVNITYTRTATGCIRTTELTVNELPAAITGTAEVCESSVTTLADATIGGSWSSSNTAMATVDALGAVTGVLAGNPIITYMLPTGCIATTTVTVNALPAVITGTMNVCEGLTTGLASATPGGLWICGSTGVATVGASTGVVTGVSAGTSDITYSFTTGCMRVANVVVNPLPAVIAGPTQVCAASSVTLTNPDAGGTWSSSDGAVATIGAGTGVVNGVVAGSAVMTYTLGTGCIRTQAMTVNVLPLVFNVTGGGSYCFGGTGVHIGMSNSELSYTYKLYLGGTLMTTQPGTAGLLDFGPLTTGGVYTVQATTGASCSRDMSGSATVTIIPLVTPAVTLASTPDDTVCAGVMTTFTASPVNGGMTPVYAWMVNGVPVSTTSTAHSYVPADGDLITVTMTSSEACPSPASVTASQTMVVVSNQTPVANIAAMQGITPLTSANTVCQGSTVLYSATSLFGGTSPVYTWYKNGISTGVTGTSYTYSPIKGDVITVKLNSNYRCPIVNNVSSSPMSIKVDSVYIPVVDIVTNTGLDIKAGTAVTFTAVVTEAGPTPEYQWYKNAMLINGATTMTYSSSTLQNNDSISCRVWGTGDCSDNTPTFNSVKMKLTTGMVQPVIGQAELRMVPNPNSGEFTVSGTFASSANAEVSLEVTDMLGQSVYKNTVMSKSGTLDQRVKLGSTLANGMYMLNVRSGGEIKTFHFVLKQ